jgi:hypothetical protein
LDFCQSKTAHHNSSILPISAPQRPEYTVFCARDVGTEHLPLHTHALVGLCQVASGSLETALQADDVVSHHHRCTPVEDRRRGKRCQLPDTRVVQEPFGQGQPTICTMCTYRASAMPPELSVRQRQGALGTWSRRMTVGYRRQEAFWGKPAQARKEDERKASQSKTMRAMGEVYKTSEVPLARCLPSACPAARPPIQPAVPVTWVDGMASALQASLDARGQTSCFH